jgi:hypothetical protein
MDELARKRQEGLWAYPLAWSNFAPMASAPPSVITSNRCKVCFGAGGTECGTCPTCKGTGASIPGAADPARIAKINADKENETGRARWRRDLDKFLLNAQRIANDIDELRHYEGNMLWQIRVHGDFREQHSYTAEQCLADLQSLRNRICPRTGRSRSAGVARRGTVFPRRGDIGERLKKARGARGLSQQKLAEELGVSREQLSRWECCVTTPMGSNLDKIRAFLEPDSKVSGTMRESARRSPIAKAKEI